MVLGESFYLDALLRDKYLHDFRNFFMTNSFNALFGINHPRLLIGKGMGNTGIMSHRGMPCQMRKWANYAKTRQQ